MGQLSRLGSILRALTPFQVIRSSEAEWTKAAGRQVTRVRIPIIPAVDGRQTRPVLVPVRVRRRS
jgi:hypothetical protein